MTQAVIEVTNSPAELHLNRASISELYVINKQVNLNAEAACVDLSVFINPISLMVNNLQERPAEFKNYSANITVSTLGIQGPKGDSANEVITWLSLATGWSILPELIANIPEGDVYAYGYEGGNTYYRLVPNGLEQDSFYTSFSEGVLSGQIATKRVAV